MADRDSVEAIHLAHMPPELTIFAAMYKDVQNAAFLHQQLLAGNSDFEYAFIDASMVGNEYLPVFKFSPRQILSRTHVLAAVFRALNDYLNGRLKSRNVHSEIVFALSPNNNVRMKSLSSGVDD